MEKKRGTQDGKFSRISPSAKLLIKDYGLEESSLKASGPRGTLLKGDVLAAIKSAGSSLQSSKPSQDDKASSTHASHVTGHVPTPTVAPSQDKDAYEDLPNSQIRKVYFHLIVSLNINGTRNLVVLKFHFRTIICYSCCHHAIVLRTV